METTVTVKGQVTVPKPLRDHLGLVPGSRVSFLLDRDGRVVLQRAEGAGGGAPSPTRFARARGATRGRNSLSTEEIMKLTRGEDGGGG